MLCGGFWCTVTYIVDKSKMYDKLPTSDLWVTHWQLLLRTNQKGVIWRIDNHNFTKLFPIDLWIAFIWIRCAPNVSIQLLRLIGHLMSSYCIFTLAWVISYCSSYCSCTWECHHNCREWEWEDFSDSKRATTIVAVQMMLNVSIWE